MKQPFPHYKFATNHLTITWITLQNSWIRNRTHRNQTLNSRFRTSFCRFHTIFSPQINIINAWITPQNVAFATEHAAINHETAVIAPPFRHLGNQNAGNQAYIRRKYTTQPLFWVWFSSFLNVGKAIFNIVFACFLTWILPFRVPVWRFWQMGNVDIRYWFAVKWRWERWNALWNSWNHGWKRPKWTPQPP